MMEVKNYLQVYEHDVVDLWNRFDPIDVGKLRRQALFDDNFNNYLAWVAVDGDRVVGFAYGTHLKYPYLPGLRSMETELSVLLTARISSIRISNAAWSPSADG